MYQFNKPLTIGNHTYGVGIHDVSDENKEDWYFEKCINAGLIEDLSPKPKQELVDEPTEPTDEEVAETVEEVVETVKEVAETVEEVAETVKEVAETVEEVAETVEEVVEEPKKPKNGRR